MNSIPLRAGAPESRFEVKSGDVFYGQILTERPNTITIKIARLEVRARNIKKTRASGDITTLFHNNGSIFSGKFKQKPGGDFHLDEGLIPDEIAISRSDLKPVEQPKPSTERHLLGFNVGAGATISAIREYLPRAYSLGLDYAYDLRTWSNRLPRWLPWPAAEAGFFASVNTPYSLTGGYAVLGAKTMFNIHRSHYFFAGILGGMNALRARDTEIDDIQVSPYFTVRAGYAYRYGAWLVGASLAISSVYDSVSPLVNIGGNFSVGFFL